MLKVVKEFYKNPEEIRNMSINSKYELINWGNYIGRDTVDHMIMTPELESRIKELFPESYYKVTCSRFRSAIEGDTHLSFVHVDSTDRDSGWHIIVYLVPDTNIKDGIVFYTDESGDTEIAVQEYEYNTAVIVDYSYFHSSMHRTGYGDCVANSRLLHIIEIMDTRTTHYKQASIGTSVGVFLQEQPYGWDNNA